MIKPRLRIGFRFSLVETRKYYTIVSADVFGFTSISDDGTHTFILKPN